MRRRLLKHILSDRPRFVRRVALVWREVIGLELYI